jgi:hypothetical protein
VWRVTDPTQPYQQPPYQVPPGYPVYVVQQRPTNGLAIASLVCSVVGIGLVGAILGHVARRQIRQTGEQGDGLALAGIIVGWVMTAFFVVWVGFAVFFLAFAASGIAQQQ